MRSAGKTTACDRPTALLLPGLLCDRAVWAAQLEALIPRVHCIVPDYGELDSLPAMAHSVLAQAPARFALIGHSMGGRVALEIVRTAAARVSALALLDTGYQARAPGAEGAHEARARHAWLEHAAAAGMRAMGRVWVRAMVHPARLEDTALIESILAMLERCRVSVFAAQIRALLGRPDASAVLASIGCPTLLLCGREDRWSPLARHEAMAALIPHSQLIVIEQCGHMSTLEQPAEVSARLSQWLVAATAARD
jgi:pimeloyl-ACP methyl ester carboxylesterase